MDCPRCYFGFIHSYFLCMRMRTHAHTHQHYVFLLNRFFLVLSISHSVSVPGLDGLTIGLFLITFMSSLSFLAKSYGYLDKGCSRKFTSRECIMFICINITVFGPFTSHVCYSFVELSWYLGHSFLMNVCFSLIKPS